MSRLLALTAVIVLATLEMQQAPAAEVVQYSIDLGSQYTFKPSLWGPGIPGGQPSAYQLDFGLSGLLAIEFDGAANTARITTAELVLSGNEDIQDNPPDEYSPVTAATVAEFLSTRLFEHVQAGEGFEEYAAQFLVDLRLRDFTDGRLSMTGGFDSTPADGTAMLFEVSAVTIPEPATLIIGGAMAACCLPFAAHRTRRARRG